MSDPGKEAAEQLREWRMKELPQDANKTFWDAGFLYGEEGTAYRTKEDVARQVANHIDHNSSDPSVTHYSYYRRMYDDWLKRGEQPGMAHELAMKNLEDEMNRRGAPDSTGDKAGVGYKWGPAQYRKLPVYDKVFPKLNEQIAAPGLPEPGGAP